MINDLLFICKKCSLDTLDDNQLPIDAQKRKRKVLNGILFLHSQMNSKAVRFHLSVVDIMQKREL